MRQPSDEMTSEMIMCRGGTGKFLTITPNKRGVVISVAAVGAHTIELDLDRHGLTQLRDCLDRVRTANAGYTS